MIQSRTSGRLFFSALSSILEKEALTAVKAQALPGIAVAVVKCHPQGEKEIVFKNYGVANHDTSVENSRSISEHTVFPIGALSKNFTALGIMILSQEGKLSLDTPLLDYLPFLRIEGGKGGTPMTLRHLMTHTSGIREFRNYFDIIRAISPIKAGKVSLKDYYANYAINPIGEPGMQHIKSHHNFGLAALVLEETTGTSLEQFCQERVFKPLGMSSTDLQLREDLRVRLTDAFSLGRSGFKVSKAADTSVVGAGGGFSTSSDLARYLQALMAPAEFGAGVITPELVDEMLTPQYRINEFLPTQAISFNTQSVLFNPKDTQKAKFTEDLAYLTSGQGMNWSGHQNAFVFSRKLGTASIVLANAGTHFYAASAMSNKILRASLPEWQLGTPASQLDSKKAALFPGHSFPQKPTPEADKASAASKSLLQQSMGLPPKAGLPSPHLWPNLVGFWQVPFNQLLTARVMWLLGGELQVYQLNGKLMFRSLIGPLRSNLMRRGPGFTLQSADPSNPFNFTVIAPQLAVSTPARGTTDISFDPDSGKLHIGLLTLEKRAWYLSLRYPTMAAIVYFFQKLIGFGRAFDITTQLLIFGF